MQNKIKNKNCNVEVVKNTNLITKDGLKKHVDIFLEQRQIHDNFQKILYGDLTGTSERPFRKTYLVETFGTTGGNHFVSVTVYQEKEGESPFIHLFDPSPSLVRNGAEANKNSTANGWNSQLIVNATIKKVLADNNIPFNTELFFNNSEPLQKAGSSICAFFALESAYEIARMEANNHINFLNNTYVYKSFFGGKTEINHEEIKQYGYLKNYDPQTALNDFAGLLLFSHFVETAILPRREQLQNTDHLKKSGQIEKNSQRISRHVSEQGNHIINDKAVKQRFFHLFEIVISECFLELLKNNQKTQFEEEIKKSSEEIKIKGSPYFPKNEIEINYNKEMKSLNDAFNKLTPRFNQVNKIIEEGDSYKVTIYLGEITGRKLIDFMQNKLSVTAQVNIIDFSQSVEDVNKDFSQIYQIQTHIPKGNLKNIVNIMNNNGCLYKQEDHPFMPPKNISSNSLSCLNLQNNDNLKQK
jgi:hypothetical protein